MAAGGDVEVKSLLLKVDASVELLRKNLSDAGQQIDNFAKKGETGARRFDDAIKKNTVSAGQMKFAMRDLSLQLGDVATSLSTGASFFTVFAQQGEQVIGALQLMTNESKGLAGFIGGPWLSIFTAAGLLISKFAFSNDDAADAEKKHKSAADELADSIDQLEKSTKQAIFSSQRQLYVTQAQTQADLQATLQKRKLIEATIDQTEAQLRGKRAELEIQRIRSTAPGQRGELATLGLDVVNSQVGGLDAQLTTLTAQRAKNDAAVARAQANVVRANAAVTQRLVNEETDAAARAQGHFERQADLLAHKLETGQITAAAYRDEYLKLTNQLDAATQTVDRHTAAHTRLTAAQRAEIREAEAFAKVIAELPGKTQAAFAEIDKQFLEGGDKAASARAKKFYEAINVNPKEQDDLVKQIDAARDERSRKSQEDIEKRFRIEADRVRTLGTIFQDAFQGGTKAIWRDFKSIGLQIIAELAAKFAVATIAGKAFNFSNALSTTIGSVLPGFAAGGSPPVGRASIVGERGPELFVPKVPGTIIPNHKLGGASVNLTINAPGATAETVSLIRRELFNAAPVIADAASRKTIATLQRPRL